MEVNQTILQHIQKAQKGDQASFTFLLDAYWNTVYRFIFTKTESESDTEDITIETFAKAFDKLPTYRTDYAFSTWLLTIAKNVYIDFVRKKKLPITDIEQKTAHAIADETPSVEDRLIIEQNLAQLLSYIKQLQPAYQEVIQLRYFQELSYTEMAQQLEQPLSNIKIKLLRAKKLLAEIILKKNN